MKAKTEYERKIYQALRRPGKTSDGRSLSLKVEIPKPKHLWNF